MSKVSYNDIVFPYAQITQFDQSAVYDDEGHTDFCLTKFDIKLNSVLNADYLSILAPRLVRPAGPVTDNAAAIMTVVRKDLLAPRKNLSVTFNDYELIPKVQDGLGTVDSANGPMPQSCAITQLTTKTFLVQYHIVAHYWENNQGLSTIDPYVKNDNGNNVLFNRWSETVEIDNKNYTTRTRDGKYRIRSDNRDGVIVDQLRSQMAVVGVPAGFNRASSSYTVSPDGLSIAYRVVDKEVFKNPPLPALTARGEYWETSTRFDAKRYADVRVELEGDKTTDQGDLLEKAIFVCASKLDINGAPLDQAAVGRNAEGRAGGRLESAEVKVDMYENKVSCHMRAWVNVAANRKAGVVILRGPVTLTPFSDPQGTVPTPIYFDRGTANLLLQAAKYYDPSLRNTQLGAGSLQSAERFRNTSDDNSQLTAGTQIGKAFVNRET